MRPSRAALATLATLASALALAGCGQMGPLVLPDTQTQGATDSDDGAGDEGEGGSENER
jgi:predicted small lipoprotein YifL